MDFTIGALVETKTTTRILHSVDKNVAWLLSSSGGLSSCSLDYLKKHYKPLPTSVEFTHEFRGAKRTVLLTPKNYAWKDGQLWIDVEEKENITAVQRSKVKEIYADLDGQKELTTKARKEEVSVEESYWNSSSKLKNICEPRVGYLASHKNNLCVIKAVHTKSADVEYMNNTTEEVSFDYLLIRPLPIKVVFKEYTSNFELAYELIPTGYFFRDKEIWVNVERNEHNIGACNKLKLHEVFETGFDKYPVYIDLLITHPEETIMFLIECITKLNNYSASTNGTKKELTSLQAQKDTVTDLKLDASTLQYLVADMKVLRGNVMSGKFSVGGQVEMLNVLIEGITRIANGESTSVNEIITA